MRYFILCIVLCSAFGLRAQGEASCAGEFITCNGTNDCVFFPSDCGKCAAGHYLCPDRRQCVGRWAQCNGLRGTFWDWRLPVETRVTLLINATTLEERIAQLQNAAPDIPRLYVPGYQWLNDDLHGLRRHRATSFPNGNGLGPTWSVATLAAIGAAIADESRALHRWYLDRGVRGISPWMNGIGMTIYAPNINLVRDPRWGRNQEVFGEDPMLTGSLAAAYVRGVQTERDGYYKAAACCKHYAAYDMESFPTQRYFYNAVVDGVNLWESYLPAFEACIEANVSHLMCSYNAVNGVPACANGRLNNDIARQKLGFGGFVVSDYDAWAQIYETHRAAANMTEAAALGFKGGCDQEGGGDAVVQAMPLAIDEGVVSEAQIDQSFARLMTTRFRLGMFDPPELVPYANYTFATHIDSEQHQRLSLTAALQSIAMYKNTPAVLPLASDGDQIIAIIGPNAAATTWLQGNYAEAPAWGIVSILEAVLNMACANQTGIRYPGLSFVDLSESPVVSPAPSADACATRCQSNLSCNYWTFDASKELCYSQRDTATTIENPNMTSGARVGRTRLEVGVSYAAITDIPVRSQDAQECSQRCRVDANCTRFTFVFPLLCYLNPTGPPVRSSLAASGGTPTKCARVLFDEACADGMPCANPHFHTTLAVARQAAIVIVVLGLDQSMESEGHDRTVIELPSAQYELTSLLTTISPATQTIGIFVHGGSFAFQSMLASLNAVVDAWYPGQQGGTAIAHVLFGLSSPAAKSTVTYYASTADLPPNLAQQDFYPNATSGYLGLTYRYYTGKVVVPFGWGMGYTTFKYSDVSLSSYSIRACDDILVNATITNIGNVSSDEVVQVYVRHTPGMVTPQIRLAAFARLTSIRPGTSQRVVLRVTPLWRSVVHNDPNDAYNATRVIPVGPIRVFIGGSQPTATAPGLVVNVTTSSKLDNCRSRGPYDRTYGMR